MTLLLLSGRPGAGKTQFAQWLAEALDFAAVEADLSSDWQDRLEVTSALEAQNVVDIATSLRDNVVVEWGFIPDERRLNSVRLLRQVGFAIWWFDADEPTAMVLWRQRHPQEPIQSYCEQKTRIDAAWPALLEIYRDRVVRTVEPGPTILPPDQIAGFVLPNASSARTSRIHS